MNWLFLIIIIFLISMAYGGYKKGIMRMLFSVISFFVATLAMIIVAPYVSDALVDSEPLMEKIKKPVYDVVMEQLDEGKNIDGILEEYHLPQKLSTSIEKFVNENYKGSIPTFLAAFTSRRKLSKKDIDEIQEMIDKIREN